MPPATVGQKVQMIEIFRGGSDPLVMREEVEIVKVGRQYVHISEPKSSFVRPTQRTVMFEEALNKAYIDFNCIANNVLFTRVLVEDEQRADQLARELSANLGELVNLKERVTNVLDEHDFNLVMYGCNSLNAKLGADNKLQVSSQNEITIRALPQDADERKKALEVRFHQCYSSIEIMRLITPYGLELEDDGSINPMGPTEGGKIEDLEARCYVKMSDTIRHLCMGEVITVNSTMSTMLEYHGVRPIASMALPCQDESNYAYRQMIYTYALTPNVKAALCECIEVMKALDKMKTY